MVHRYTLLAAVLIGIVSAATTFHWTGALSGFFVYQEAAGNRIITSAYDTCSAVGNDNAIKWAGYVCMAKALYYLTSGVTAFLGGGYGVAAISDGIYGASESLAPTPPAGRRDLRQRTSDFDRGVVDHVNAHFASLPGAGGPDHPQLFATDVVPSHIHPNDGFAVHMNVHGDGSTMAIHTNGSHAMVRFDEGVNLGRRDFLPTDNTYWKFTGLDGIKMEAHDINNPVGGSDKDQYNQDIIDFSDRFGKSDLKPHPIWKDSDAWNYQICRKDNKIIFAYGRLIAEESRPGLNYEYVDPIGCK